MSQLERLQQKQKELQKHFDLLSEKILHLRENCGIETDPAIKLKLEKQIEGVFHSLFTHQFQSLWKNLIFS